MGIVDMTMPADDRSEVLTPIAAAAMLGITPELLFAYTIYAPKRARGDARRLLYVNDPSHSGFRRADLEAFNQYLWDAWSDDPKKRPDLPTYVADYLKVECGGQCARCGKGFKLANAHIVPWADSLSYHHHNLIRLCSACHDEYDATHLIARAEMQSLKERLIARLRSRLTAPPQIGVSARAPTPLLRFVGRDHELGDLVELLQTRRTISLEGPGGIGKTQLLIHALQRLPEEQRVLWIDIQAFKSVSDIKLAVEAGLETGGTAVQGRLLREVLADLDITLVFDGVEDLTTAGDEMLDFFQSLITHTRRPRIVFTSQIELHGVDIAETFTVGPLEREAGMSVLRSNQTGQSADHSDNDMDWLAEFCEGHPLALTLVRGLLDYFKSAVTVKRRVCEHGAAALAAPTRQRHTPSTSLRACLLVSYQALSLEQRSCLFLVSHSPAGCVDQHLARDQEYPIGRVEEDIAALLRWHLVDSEDWAGHVRLYILSPIRAFVLNEWNSVATPVKEKLRLHLTMSHTMQAMVLCDRHIQKADARYGVFRFDQEFPNLLYTFRHAVKARWPKMTTCRTSAPLPIA
jgi:5-methylcytosine-specific restriction endonuclease McrA